MLWRVLLVSTDVVLIYCYSDVLAEMSVTQTLLALNRAEKLEEEADQSFEDGVTASTWVLEGIEIETQQ